MSANKSETVWSGPCCGAMLLSLNVDNSTKPGLHEVELTSLKTGTSRRVGIALRQPDKTVVYINFCPFCGARHEPCVGTGVQSAKKATARNVG